jgi:two-component system, sensor histidine kinase ChiS
MASRFLRFLIFAIVVTAVAGCTPPDNRRPAPGIVNGVMDLGDWDFARDGAVKLAGDWAFYWNRFLKPDDFSRSQPPLTGYRKVPRYWTKYPGDDLPAKGSATYRLVIKTHGPVGELSLKTPEIYTEFSLWINGKPIDRHGTPAGLPFRYLKPAVHTFSSSGDAIDIVLQIRNVAHGNAGIGQSFVIGTTHELYAKRYAILILELVVAGICLFIGGYHLLLFAFRGRDKTLLYFGLFCIAIAIRGIFSGETGIMDLFPDLPFWVGSRILTITIPLCCMTFLLYADHLHAEGFHRKTFRLLLALQGLYLAMVLVLPTFVYAWVFQYYLGLLLVSSLIVLYWVVQSIRQGNRLSWLFLGGSAFLLVGMYNDMLYYLQVIDTGYHLSLWFSTFILIQSLMLAIRFAQEQRIIEGLTQRLQALDKLKDDFLANTSHELRTPINGIIGIGESLIAGATGVLSRKTLRNLEMIVSSGRRLASLVNDILDYSRLRNNDIAMQNRRVDIRQIVSVVMTVLDATRPNGQVTLINTIPEGLPPIMGDENRLQQILYNLLGNALKFTPQGTIKVTAAERPDTVELCVEDTGIGIPPERIDGIFQSFEQADPSVSRQYGGTGLGLSITKRLVELHGGRIHVESEPGRGSKFCVTLRKASEDSAAPADGGALEPASGTAGRAAALPVPREAGGTEATAFILVVDDERVNRQVLENHLSLKGYRLDTAENGIAAIDKIQKNTYDLVLLDIMMPRMSGYEVCRIIRGSHTLNELPVLVLTAKSQPGDVAAAFQVGANDYLTKPFEKDELLARIQTLLLLRTKTREAAENAHRASIDSLTGLNNRRSLWEIGSKLFNAARRHNRDLSVIMIDVDHFKRFNDAYGHSFGDEVLRQIAIHIASALRKEDVAARYGGEEFAVLLPDSSLKAALQVAERIQIIVEAGCTSIAGMGNLNCTISAGVAALGDDMASLDALIKAADTLMYKAKGSGRNRIAGY